MTDITELAQRMKTAAEKLDADQWQTRKGFSGIEVIVKGSLEKGHGCVSFQPVAADMADTKTARAIALFSPANVLALVEALEKAQGMEAYWKTQCRGITDHCEELQARIAELESRTVKLPKLKMLEDYLAEVAIEERKQILVGVKLEFHRACVAAGIKWEAE
ncbi:TPA: ead/Ea22-like family protein [Klebsiella pneumoniae]|uniref:ead/Ea22-like family protein n=1 Tax=Klebsiella pneumoniae TaxID=573 RepID=UPI0007CCD184|nr:ead/Ea22-like family protein [Klebsiella pneumoniae]PXG87879.1 hypothetical protein DMP69_09845 [Klebsiella pneumoniae]SAW44722.1 RelE family toxin-antitoxin system [Klebsiella pneumoniae]SYU52932.1 RelE family toxin-antitoxin system [Klebsiella pneumoniae]HBR4147823.1 ead/Ea22-like family protein [Klebsiella pneumoniae]HDP1356698.1 ead/Ea22-like family protein [Klebsiella pneumoniae]